jgi:hypothetical protein
MPVNFEEVLGLEEVVQIQAMAQCRIRYIMSHLGVGLGGQWMPGTGPFYRVSGSVTIRRGGLMGNLPVRLDT